MTAASDCGPAPRTDDGVRVDLGAIKSEFGTRGWVRVYSLTRPRAGIFDYPHWLIGARGEWREYIVEQWHAQGSALVGKLVGVDDRTAAAALAGKQIAIDARVLPPAPADSYYWRDLVGLDVVNLERQFLGVVTALVETGSSDVLCVRGERERLIPFVREVYVTDVDLGARRIMVDWHADD